MGCHAHPPGDLPNLGIKSRLPALQADSLLSEPPGKPNTGVGSLSLLQGYLPDPGIKLVSPALHADSLPVELPGKLYYVCVLVTQSFPTLCNPMDCSPPGSSVHGILQAQILEWLPIPFSRGIFPTQGSNPCVLLCRQILYHLSHQIRSDQSLSHVRLFATP